jgi:hypothetical protein
MANPTWPASLPVPLDEGMSYAPFVENVTTTQMETGSPKRRRRFTAVPETLTCTLILTAAQMATLEAFVATTLQDVLPFDWKDFRDGRIATYYFQKRPSYALAAAGANLWKAQLELVKKA